MLAAGIRRPSSSIPTARSSTSSTGPASAYLNRAFFEMYDEPALKTIEGVASINGHDSAWFKDSEGDFIELLGPD